MIRSTRQPLPKSIPESQAVENPIATVKLLARLDPGQTAEAKFVRWNPSIGELEDGTLSLTVTDRHAPPLDNGATYGQNFGLFGEYFKVQHQHDGTWMPIGSQGLHRAIQIYDGTKAEGYVLTASSATAYDDTSIYVHPARIRYLREGFVISTSVWFCPLNRFDSYSGNWPARNYLELDAFCVGTATVSSDERPLLMARHPEMIYDAKVGASPITANSTGNVTVYWNGSSLSQTLTGAYKWITPASSLPTNKELRIRFQEDVYEWRIVDHGCV